MRWRAFLAGGAALVAAPLALAHRPARARPEALAPAPGHVRGALHVHTAASGDARGDIDHVTRAAARAGLGFLVVTDHASELSPGLDGYRNGVLVLGGLEKSTDAGHALALGLGALPFRLDGDPAAVARDVSDLGGFVVAAHPRSQRSERRWQADLTGVTGIELLNLAEPGARSAGLALVPHLLRYLVDPQGALLAGLGVSREALSAWDAELRKRPLVGVLGSDAHGGIPSHLEVFRLASQHLLLEQPLSGDAGADRAAVLEALRLGRGWAALDALADASRFAFEARSGSRRARPGESLILDGSVELRAAVAAPPGTELVLLRDGEAVARGPAILHTTRRPGTYRVEAYLEARLVPGAAKPWILSNPIDLYDAGTLAEREARARARPPLDAPLPARVEPLDDFSSLKPAERWQLDRSRDARASFVQQAGTLRFDFTLGPGLASHASLCAWGARDLASHSALVFSVRADRTFRFDVQVRVEDEAAPAGVRIWRRSVRAQAAWRRVAVPFDALKTYDKLGGRPDLSRVRGLYFHIDEAHLAPGGSGTLWLDDLGLGR